MQLFNTFTFLVISAYVVVADQTFQLTAQGNGINTPVTFTDSAVTLNNGQVGTFTLNEPSGYLSVSATQYVTNSENGIVLTGSTGTASKDWGLINNNQLRFNVGTGNTNFWACPADTGYTLYNFQRSGCTQVQIFAGDVTGPADTTEQETTTAAPETSSEAPAPEPTTTETTSEAPAPAPTSTVTTVEPASSTIETFYTNSTSTSAAPATSSAASITSEYQGGAARNVANGAALIAAAALLL
ncbi:hypothetical protein DFJ63DRAFT_318823 [Scheffersomyces coipomensis]|uniref:uncharacterized protein n=1 Tax=Scheffersomyces coipomensis TaxID=1788519 RepID=UPI00315D63E7